MQASTETQRKNLSGHALNTTDADDMQRTDHDGVFVIRQSHNDLMSDYGGVFGMLDPINLSTAAMDFKWSERRVLQKLANLFEHGARYNAGGADARTEAKPALVRQHAKYGTFNENSS